MPNHVTTMVRMTPEAAFAFTRTHTEEERAEHARNEDKRRVRMIEAGRGDLFKQESLSDDRFVDFALVIPEPESIFRGGCNMQHPHPKEDGSGFYEHCWNGWNRDNWGTKWNGYDSTVEPTEGDLVIVRFDSAWSHPFPVMQALSEKFPEDRFEVMFADEDLGYNLGIYTMVNGEVIEESDIEPGSDTALDIASGIKYGKSYAEQKKEWGE